MVTMPAHPQSIGQVISTGIQLWWKTIRYWLIYAIFGVLSGLAYYKIIAFPARSGPTRLVFSNLTATEIAVLIAVFFIYLIMLCVIHMGIIITIYSRTQNHVLNLKQTIALALQRFFPFFFTSLAMGFITLLGLICLVLPGILLMVMLCLAPYISVMTKKGPWDSIKESKDLVSQNWWRTATVSFTLILLAIIEILILFVIGFALASASIHIPLDHWGFGLMSEIAVFFNTSLMYAVLISLYFDLQARRRIRLESSLSKV